MDEIGAGRGTINTPGSSLFIINRDAFRSIRRGRQLFQRKFKRVQGQGPGVDDGVGNIATTIGMRLGKAVDISSRSQDFTCQTITLGDGSGVVRETVKDVLKGGQKNLLLNLGDVSYIDSSGLGELVGAYATGANQGRQIKLLNVQKKVHDSYR
jgi:hypothetical protein